MCVCLSVTVAKDIANHRIDIVLIYIEAFIIICYGLPQPSREKSPQEKCPTPTKTNFFHFKTKVQSGGCTSSPLY